MDVLPQPGLLTARETARRLNVSETWVRRHRHQIGAVYVGRQLRFDPVSLSQRLRLQFPPTGKPLKPEGRHVLQRWQRGSVYKTGKKSVWYGRFRVDVRDADGVIRRRTRKVRLGPVAEIPTRGEAAHRLEQLLAVPSKPKTQMKFSELVERWKVVAVPTLKSSTAGHHCNSLRSLMPVFGEQEIAQITRYAISLFLAEQATRYARNTLHSFKTGLSVVFGFAVLNGWLEENPCSGVKLPRSENCGGRRVRRSVLTEAQVTTIVANLPEPYATLVVFLAVTGLRIGEAIAIKWSDFDGDVLHVQRRIYEGQVDVTKTQKSERKLPIPASLLSRLQALRQGSAASTWVFQAENGAAINPGNARNRYIRPVAKRLGVAIGGWHDFRHTLTTNMRRSGVHPKVISGVLGHSNVRLAMDVYDHLDVRDMRDPLRFAAENLLPNVPKLSGATENVLIPNEMVSAEGIEPSTY